MQSVNFYNENAQYFVERTLSADLSELYVPFLAEIPHGAHILDAGCGPGRDSLYFKQHGYRITALDASEALVASSSKLLDQPVLHMTFQEMDFADEFDAVWACASLLHVPRAEIDDVLERITCALKPGGVFFASFKYGSTEGHRNGRWFNDYDEATFAELLTHHPALTLLRARTTTDVRPDRQGDQWLDVLARKH